MPQTTGAVEQLHSQLIRSSAPRSFGAVFSPPELRGVRGWDVYGQSKKAYDLAADLLVSQCERTKHTD